MEFLLLLTFYAVGFFLRMCFVGFSFGGLSLVFFCSGDGSGLRDAHFLCNLFQIYWNTLSSRLSGQVH